MRPHGSDRPGSAEPAGPEQHAGGAGREEERQPERGVCYGGDEEIGGEQRRGQIRVQVDGISAEG